MINRLCLLFCLGILNQPDIAIALESSAPEMPAVHPNEKRAGLLKPTYLFNMRGRRDPFVNAGIWQTAGSGTFSISFLSFKGIIEVDGLSTALFVSSTDKGMYTLRGNRLFKSNEKPVPGVSGHMVSGNEVRLRQGELSLNFSALHLSKRKI